MLFSKILSQKKGVEVTHIPKKKKKKKKTDDDDQKKNTRKENPKP